MTSSTALLGARRPTASHRAPRARAGRSPSAPVGRREVDDRGHHGGGGEPLGDQVGPVELGDGHPEDGPPGQAAQLQSGLDLVAGQAVVPRGEEAGGVTLW